MFSRTRLLFRDFSVFSVVGFDITLINRRSVCHEGAADHRRSQANMPVQGGKKERFPQAYQGRLNDHRRIKKDHWRRFRFMQRGTMYAAHYRNAQIKGIVLCAKYFYPFVIVDIFSDVAYIRFYSVSHLACSFLNSIIPIFHAYRGGFRPYNNLLSLQGDIITNA